MVLACGCSSAPVRDITLIARGMTFVLAEAPSVPNPAIPLEAGERVRIVLRNEAPGLLHDFTIPEWNVRVDHIRAGETAETTFTVPSHIGTTRYQCTPHAELMNGVVEVR